MTACWRHASAGAAFVAAVVLGASFPTPTSGQTPATAKPSPPRARAGAATKAAPVDLNHATAEHMAEVLPGIGEANARKIIAGRPYASVDDLARVGLPAREIDRLRPLVVVTPPNGPRTGAMTRPPVAGTARNPLATPAPVPAGKVNLNEATAEQLQTLPGIGPAHAREIMAARPIRSVDDLARVKGLGRTRIDAIRDRVVLDTSIAPVAPSAGTVTRRAMPRTAPAPAPAATTAADTTPAARTRPAGKAAAAPRLAPGQRVNLNTATKEQLDALPGIGPVKAQAILDARPFKSKEDVMRVRGIKEGEFAKIRDVITVD